MNIASLGGWLSKQLEGNKQPIPIFPQPNPQKKQPTIQPDVPVPSYRPTADGGYEVLNQPPGTSAFAPMGPLVLKNPGRGLPRFDPTGEYNDNNLPNNMHPFLLMPMAQPEFKHFDYLQPIGRGF